MFINSTVEKPSAEHVQQMKTLALQCGTPIACRCRQEVSSESAVSCLIGALGSMATKTEPGPDCADK